MERKTIYYSITVVGMLIVWNFFSPTPKPIQQDDLEYIIKETSNKDIDSLLLILTTE